MKLKHSCKGCRSVIRDSDEWFSAGEYFAGVLARREYGRRGHVGVCRLNSMTEDGRINEFEAFVGVSDGHGMTGKNIHFVVTSEQVEA